MNLTDILFDRVISFLLLIPAIVIHEYAHAYVAYKLGDPTSKYEGRLTFNPLKHIDTLGFLLFLTSGIGFAKAVNINTNYFKNRKLGLFLTAFAGPFVNIVLSALFVVAIIVISIFSTNQFIMYILFVGIVINLSLATFNLLPIPPFDGFKMLMALVPKSIEYQLAKLDQSWINIMGVQVHWILLLFLIPNPLTDILYKSQNYLFDLIIGILLQV